MHDYRIKIIKMTLSSKSKAILCVLITTILISIGQLIWKFATISMSFNSVYSLIITFLNFKLIFGFFIYGIAMFFFILALKYGELSLVHPLLSLSQIWTLILAVLFLGERITILKLFSLCFIMAGSLLISTDGGNL